MKIIILAGGGGSRLFPLSRKSYPKQFLKLEDEKSLLVHTVERVLGFCGAGGYSGGDESALSLPCAE